MNDLITSLVIPVLVFIFGVIVVWLLREDLSDLLRRITKIEKIGLIASTNHEEINENNFRGRYIRGDNGEESYEDIDNSERTIDLTSFSADQPTDKYINKMLSKLDDGVIITRYIPNNISDDKLAWLERFEKKEHYYPLYLKKPPLPFDVLIFDDKKVKLFFPDNQNHSHFKDGIELIGKDVAKKFKVVLQALVE